MTAATTAIGLTMGGRTYTVEDVAHVGPEYETVHCQVPDEMWSATDTNGHEHRHWQPAAGGDLALPTLTRNTRHVECDGVHIGGFLSGEPCEGYDETYWTCIVCGDLVQPGNRPGTRSYKSREGHTEVTTTIDAADLADENGYVALSPAPARHDVAHLVWPAGPGQMLEIRGKAWEIGAAEATFEGKGPTRLTQRWAISETSARH